MRSILAEHGELKEMRKFEASNVAVRPEVTVCGIVPGAPSFMMHLVRFLSASLLAEKSTMFTSKLTPLMCCFTQTDGSPYRVSLEPFVGLRLNL